MLNISKILVITPNNVFIFMTQVILKLEMIYLLLLGHIWLPKLMQTALSERANYSTRNFTTTQKFLSAEYDVTNAIDE